MMVIYLILILILAIFLIACAGIYLLFLIKSRLKYKKISKYPLPALLAKKVFIDRKFSLKEKEKIFKALKHWEMATYGLVRFYIVNKNAISHNVMKYSKELNSNQICDFVHIGKLKEGDDKLKEIDKYEKGKIFGYCWMHYSPRIILLVPERTPNLLATTIHELGHTLGMSHSWQPQSIMNQYLNTGKIITETDLQNLVAIAVRDFKLRSKG